MNTLMNFHARNGLRAAAVMLPLLFASTSDAVFLVGPDLVPLDSDDGKTKIFTTEVKFDQTPNGGPNGHDMFLRLGDTFNGSSDSVVWGPTGTVYDWELAYDGDLASLTVAGQTINLDIDPDGGWDAFKVIVRSTDTRRFDSASTTVTIDMVNGGELDSPETYVADLGEFNEFLRTTDPSETITSLSGQLTFHYDFADGASGSPNSNYAFIIKAYQCENVLVPEPAGALLAALGLAFAGVRRRVG